jgi:hypothetical protein
MLLASVVTQTVLMYSKSSTSGNLPGLSTSDINGEGLRTGKQKSRNYLPRTPRSIAELDAV